MGIIWRYIECTPGLKKKSVTPLLVTQNGWQVRETTMFDFDASISRAGTHAEKYTALQRLFGSDDILPFWVADMEFPVAPAVREALAARVGHPVYGYTSVPESLVEAIVCWCGKRYGISLTGDSVTLIPGVMSGVSAAMYALSEKEDAVIVQPPLYPPLMHTVRKNGRLLVENPLVVIDGEYRIDFNELERLFQVHQPKLLLFCSPHNPVGRVWRKDEVDLIVELTEKYGVYLVSDEIHADIIFSPHVHFSALSSVPGANSHVIILNSASKSFNVAGLNTAYALIPDLKLRTSFRQALRRMNLHSVNIFGMAALEAAYREGEQWLDELLCYLQNNRQYMTDILKDKLPSLKQYIPEGTYLSWLDFNSLGLPAGQIRERLIDVARVGLNDGITFSRHHEGFWRFNFGVPRSMLEQGLERIIRAFQ